MNHLERLHEHGRSTCVSQPESAAVINNVHQRRGGRREAGEGNVSLWCNTWKPAQQQGQKYCLRAGLPSYVWEEMLRIWLGRQRSHFIISIFLFISWPKASLSCFSHTSRQERSPCRTESPTFNGFWSLKDWRVWCFWRLVAHIFITKYKKLIKETWKKNSWIAKTRELKMLLRN